MPLTSLRLDSVDTTDTGATEFRFDIRRHLAFRSGQAALFALSGGGVKPFSIASGESRPTVSIATELHAGSRFKQALTRLRPGGRIILCGPFGLMPRLDASAPNIFVAQGIGITPFLSMVRTNQTVNADLLHIGAPHFYDEVARGVTRAQLCDHRQQLHDAIRMAHDRRGDATWWMAGSSSFVHSVSDWIGQFGVPRKRINKDAYIGMRNGARNPTSLRDESNRPLITFDPAPRPSETTRQTSVLR